MLGLQKNVAQIKKVRLSPWRKVSMATWKIVDDSSVHGLLKVNADELLKYLDKLNQNSSKKITLTHVMIKLLGKVINRYPDANSFIRFGKLYQRQDTDIFVHIAADDEGNELTGTVIRQAHMKNISEIAKELSDTAKEYKSGAKSEFDQIKTMLKFLPTFLLRPALQLVGFILYSLNLWSPLLGVKRDPFSGIMFTNVGSLGVDLAYTPLATYSRVSFLMAMGQIQDSFKWETDKMIPSKELYLTTTFDHRILDGVHAAKMCNYIRELVANPSLLDD